MAYTPYYSGGWQSGEEGNTPITPAALNNMEQGIENANAIGDPVTVAHGGTNATTALAALENLGAPSAVFISSTAGVSWEAIYNVLYPLQVSKTHCVYFGQTPANIITNGKVSGSILYGIFVRSVSSGNESWVFMLANAAASIYTFNIQGVTSAGGTFGSIYKHTGTAV